MPPKRCVKISALSGKIGTGPEKLPKGRKKKGNPLKVPSVITISIPGKNGGVDILDTEKNIDLHTKIALANEVARSQLSNQPIDARLPAPLVPKKGRKKKHETVSEFFVNNNTNSTPDMKVGKKARGAPKKINNKACKKAPAQTLVQERVVTRKRKADSTEVNTNLKGHKESKTIPIEPLLPKVEPLDETATSKDNVDAKEIDNESKPKLFDLPMVILPKKRRRLCIGKRNNKSQTKSLQNVHSCNELQKPQTQKKMFNNRSKGESPILEPSNITKPIPRDIRAYNMAKVSSHKVSPTSSISNLSWTHDISSTTTCFTVSSKDYVCFDSKIPIVKLDNMDNKINKLVPKDSKVNDKNKSSDDSSTSNIETSCDQSMSLTCSDSFVKINSLNLSCSSQNSIVKNDDNNKVKSNKKDYARAAENLVQALEKIDMEFINWIHEPEHVSPDLNKLNDKLFDILNSEFSALAHCKRLKEISVNDLMDEKISKNSNDKNKNTHEAETETACANSEQKHFKVNDVNLKNIVTEPIQREHIKKRYTTEIIRSDVENNRETRIETEGDLTKPSTSGVVSNALSNRDVDTSASEDSSDSGDLTKARSFTSYSPRSPHDDDDALSLFAESITGIESSKQNMSIASPTNEKQAEEYIPEPVQKICLSPPNYTYCPTKIADTNKNGIIKIVCEKQNADSTSIHRETDNNSLINKELASTIETGDVAGFNITGTDNEHGLIIGRSNVEQGFSIAGASVERGFNTADRDVEQGLDVESRDCSTQGFNTAITGYFEDRLGNPDTGDVEQVFQQNSVRNVYSNVCTANNFKKPLLIADLYKLEPKSVNIIFQGYCYFNIIQKCTSTMFNKPCRYSHNIPDENVIKNKLSLLDVDLFIKEYMLVRRQEHVMRRYGLCFVEECATRRLTRLLVEMALDFVMKGPVIDDTLKVNAIELTLLHLNNVNLNQCEDLLKVRVYGSRLLCDVFMETMTNSQNFSRFKSVFLSLTHFLVNNNRTFILNVAEQILERVCILPFDEPVVRALIQVMRLTNPKIFLNSMIAQFEKQISVNSEVFEEYASVKREINFGNIGRRVDFKTMIIPVEPQPFQPMPQTLGQTEDLPQFEMREGVIPLPPSPDTTHLDVMTKTTEDTKLPKIIRTITSTPKPHSVSSPNSSISEEVVQNPNPKNWRHRSIFQKIDRLMTDQRIDHRLVTLGGSPNNYPPSAAKY